MKGVSVQNGLIAIFSLAVLATYAALSLNNIGQTSFDDAYMITRYANHWLAGDGFSWNAADGPSYGITSPAYLFVITAVMGLTDFSDGTVLTLTSFLAGLLSVVALVALGFLIQYGKRSPLSWTPLLAAPALVLIHPFKEHSLTGMETTLSLLANALIACAMVLVVRQRGITALLLGIAAGLFAFTTRPDNGVYALLLPPIYFFMSDRSLWKHALFYVSTLGLLIGLSLVASKFLFGDFFPLPFFAKSTGFYEGYVGAYQWNAFLYMLLFCTACTPFLLVIAGTISRRTAPQVLVLLVAVGLTFMYYATATQIMGAGARYYYPSLAFVVLAAFTTAFAPTEPGEQPFGYPFPGLRLTLGLVFLLPPLSGELEAKGSRLWERFVIGSPTAIQSTTQYQSATDKPLPEIAWWPKLIAMSDFLGHVPQQTVFAASEYGYIGSKFPDMTMVDLVGLHDRQIAHRGFDAGYVLSKSPDLIWLPHHHYTGAVAALVDNPVFLRDYEYYAAVYGYGIAFRRDSERYAAIKEAANEAFPRLYPGLQLADYLSTPISSPVAE